MRHYSARTLPRSTWNTGNPAPRRELRRLTAPVITAARRSRRARPSSRSRAPAIELGGRVVDEQHAASARVGAHRRATWPDQRCRRELLLAARSLVLDRRCSSRTRVGAMRARPRVAVLRDPRASAVGSASAKLIVVGPPAPVVAASAAGSSSRCRSSRHDWRQSREVVVRGARRLSSPASASSAVHGRSSARRARCFERRVALPQRPAVARQASRKPCSTWNTPQSRNRRRSLGPPSISSCMPGSTRAPAAAAASVRHARRPARRRSSSRAVPASNATPEPPRARPSRRLRRTRAKPSLPC